MMTAEDSWTAFSSELSAVLGEHSGRALAARTHWGRTTVAEIKAGQRRPTQRQLSDLLSAAGVAPELRRRWASRLEALPGFSGTSVVDPAGQEAMTEPDEAPTPREPRRLRRILVVAGVGLVAVALLAAAVMTRPDQTTSSEPSGAESSSPAETSRGPGGSIDLPLDQASVSSREGAELRGSAARLDGGTLWLVDRDTDGVYTADTGVEMTGPTTWTALDQPIGEPGDIPVKLVILLIYADDDCAAFLRRKVGAGDSSFESLPKSCTVLDQLTVTVDRP